MPKWIFIVTKIKLSAAKALFVGLPGRLKSRVTPR
jgi:hypothetical protein